MQSKKECFVCGGHYMLESHHIFYGHKNREKSEQYGLKVWLCLEHHRGTKGVHGKDGYELGNLLKIAGQEMFELRVGTRDEFRQAFGRSYL